MSRSARKIKKRTPKTSARRDSPKTKAVSRFRITRRQAAIALSALALAYAFLAGFHTIDETDMGWHMATGRYVLQHHVIPTTDVLSYTSPGAEWIYPPFGGVLFCLIHSAAGYAGLTWFCALALTGLVACLLRRPSRPQSIAVAVLAIFAVPELALRISPRPDLFNQLFFAIFLVLLWRFHLGADIDEGSPSAHIRLWLLPAVMLFWANFHPGFIIGLGTVFAYLMAEGLELISRARRAATLKRLRLAWPPLAATMVATLLNPFGYKIYKASVDLAFLLPTNRPTRGLLITEFDAVPKSLPSLAGALDWRNPDSSFWWMVIVAVAVVALALWRRRFSAALLTAMALYEGMQHIRYKGLFVIVVVVVGAPILTEVLTRREETGVVPGTGSSRPLPLLAALAVIAVGLLVCVRGIDLVSSRAYILTMNTNLFGAGESSWFPERAADFILREHLPGNVFQTWDLGGFSAWHLAPAYAEFIDARDVSPAVWNEYQDVIGSPPDSPQWESEFTRRNVNTLLFPLSRIRGLGIPSLAAMCNGRLFRPVYMDEVSIVLLRDSPENRPWLNRLQIDCSKQQFTPPANASRAKLSAFYANAGCIELYLGRVGEAERDLNHSAALAPEDVLVHLALANLYAYSQRFGDAEEQYKTAISLRSDNANIWLQLAEFYVSRRRFADARPLAWEAAQLSEHPARAYVDLGEIDLALHEPEQARVDFDRADETAVEFRGREDQHREFYAHIDAGRAVAYAAAKDWTRAIEYQQEATRSTPEDPSQWQKLAEIAEEAGQEQLAEQARKQAQALSKH